MAYIKLGKKALYPDHYDANLLHPIHRKEARKALGVNEPLPFIGDDHWTAYELSWLNRQGKPLAAIAEFRFFAQSDAIVESKSLKYYLNSFNQTPFASIDEVQATLIRDLSAASGAPVEVCCYPVDAYPRKLAAFSGYCVDDLDVEIAHYQPDRALLAYTDEVIQQEALYSHLLKSNCPVTGQPDWATLWVCYSGRQLMPESFLRYVVSYRQHQDFHENCVEKIFCDLLGAGQPTSLAVYARYTRRGGLDINPFRATPDWSDKAIDEVERLRVARQ